MKHFRVTVACCTSAMCQDCHNRGATGRLDKRTWKLIGENLTEERAKIYIKNWAQYSPRMAINDD